MRPVFALPLFGFAFALGFNTMGAACMVRNRVVAALAAAPVSTTTLTSGTVEAEAKAGDPLASVHAKAPSGGPLRFELARIRDRTGSETYVFVRPVGWTAKHPAFPSDLTPAEKTAGFHVAGLEVGAHCDGLCEPKDWSSIIDAKVKEAMAGGSFTSEHRMLDKRVVISGKKEGGAAHVRAYWFEPGARQYYSCEATLGDEKLTPYLDAFIEICKTARVEK